MPHKQVRPRIISVLEHQSIPVTDGPSNTGISAEEADYLAKLGEERPGFFERRYQCVRLAQYCGLVRIGDRLLEILPKVGEAVDGAGSTGRAVLIRLLRLAGQFPIFKTQHADHRLHQAHLLNIFISAFLDEVAELARGGLMRRYQEHEEDLHFLRGRIQLDRQFAALANRRDVIACRFDDLTADNPWNQVIKAAIASVRPWISSLELQRRSAEMWAVFDEVSDPESPKEVLAKLVPDRQAARYRACIRWAGWILNLLSPSVTAGLASAPGLLCDMNKLFESAVASVLSQRARGSTRVLAQDVGTFLGTIVESGGVTEYGLRPDLLVLRATGTTGIGDTKWKRLEMADAGYLVPSSADAYQMQAYSLGFDCKSLALIYPWHEGLEGSRETAFDLRGGARLTVICLDLTTDSLMPRRGGSAIGFEGLLEPVLQLHSKAAPPKHL